MPTRKIPSPVTAKVGARIRALRNERGLSREQLANASHLSQSHLTNIEKGIGAITVATLDYIAHGLDVLPADLLVFPEEDELGRLTNLIRKIPKADLPALKRKLEAREKDTDD